MAAAIFAGIGAATGLAQGIFGASEASRQNAAADRAYKEQVKQQKQIAKATNKYNKEVHEADKENFYAQRDYQFQQANQTWQRGNEIQDYQYLQGLRQFQRDIGIRDEQLNYNDLAGKQAVANENAALAGIFSQQMFDREDQVLGLKKALTEVALNRRTTQLEMQNVATKGVLGSLSIQETLKEFTKQTDFKKESALVESLEAQGKNQLGQAGGSLRKRGQATMAEFYRGMSELTTTLSGRQRQAALQLAELGVETSILEKKLGIQMESLDNAALSAVSDAQFNMRILDADVVSAIAASERNVNQISLQKYGADLNAAAQVMIKPERLPYSPAPTITPDRIWVKPMKVVPGAVAQPIKQSVTAPLLSGLVSAAQGAMQAANIHYAKNQSNTLGNIFTNPLNTQGKLTGGVF